MKKLSLQKVAAFAAILLAGVIGIQQLLAQSENPNSNATKPNPSLTPPGAPADNVFKTLNQVEPRIPINATNTPGDANSVFKITQPGSYYLTGNVQGESGKDGIRIEAFDEEVSLDLAGMTLEGVAGSGNGIYSNAKTVSIFNGVIRNFDGTGVLAIGANIFNVELISNAVGIRADSESSIRNCSVSSSRIVNGSGGHGILAGFGTHVAICNSSLNKGVGIGLIGSNVIVEGCLLRLNEGGGIELGLGDDKAIIRNNLISGLGAGIDCASTGARIEGNHLIGNQKGIAVSGTKCIIIRNSCLNNTPDNGVTDKDYEIAVGNIVGTIVTQTNGSAISGNSGGGTGTTDPFANFAD